ncbi:hypothetical protein MG293_014252 [Ovis ammon polii]|uniref:Uncharacterized protein n=1 Tax=Ovis ammon polii TaxID=230172 RepID=A0AAD4U2F6_OVIAM|nr:hypothetical protein MG293_014252 [Ovis ammon polii]
MGMSTSTVSELSSVSVFLFYLFATESQTSNISATKNGNELKLVHINISASFHVLIAAYSQVSGKSNPYNSSQTLHQLPPARLENRHEEISRPENVAAECNDFWTLMSTSSSWVFIVCIRARTEDIKMNKADTLAFKMLEVDQQKTGTLDTGRLVTGWGRQVSEDATVSLLGNAQKKPFPSSDINEEILEPQILEIPLSGNESWQKLRYVPESGETESLGP